MNDETREQLSAYLDGALTVDERRDLEARLAASAELRGALEDLRAVSRAVKDLPKEPLPSGFMTRFQGRRARGEAPRENWVFLPPQARPVVAALSVGVVALLIWDKVTVAPEQEFLHPTESAKVYESAKAPIAQLDVSGKTAGAGGSADSAGALSDAKSLEIAGAAAAPERENDKLAFLDGEASMQSAERPKAKKAALSGMRGASARAAGSPIAADAAAPSAAASEPQLTDRTRLAMTEEERSARNEEIFGQLEKQKKEMGIKIIPKDEDAGTTERPGFFARRAAPVAPVVRAAVPNMLKSDKPAAAPVAAASAPAVSGLGRLAPDAGLVFVDAGSLGSSWVLLGLPGDPPSMDFTTGRLVIIKPSATKILSVTPGADAVTVVYRSLLPDEESDPARDRVAPLPAAPKTVLIYDASPR
jgi:hypothetical protein